jgi:hypothetical protein
MSRSRMKFTSVFALLALAAFGGVACSSSNTVTSVSNPAGTPVPPATLFNAVSVSNAWAPAVTGVSTANAKGTVTVTAAASNVFTQTAGMVRLDQPWTGKIVTVDLGSHVVANDFGPNGSISLTAETLNYPYQGGAYPVLSSFYIVDSSNVTHEYVNLTAACNNSGMWSCSSGSCAVNPSCAPQAISGFANRADWDQHQLSAYGYSSTNAFPRCDSTIAGWTCDPSVSALIDGHYYANYILLSDSAGDVSTTTATLKVTTMIKKDTSARNATAHNGAVDLNVILVGDQNVNDSHTDMGKQNLNLLFAEVNNVLITSGANIGVNSVKVYEWRDANGGDQYSQVDYDTGLGPMFAAGSQGVDAADNGNRINIFLVSDINISGASYTILGISGGILGPLVNGTQTSGLAFASFNELATFNSNCTVGSCPRESQDSDFLEMGATIGHELGHYLGLNHPSETTTDPTNQRQDQLSDTPQCGPRLSGGTYILDQRSCYTDTTDTMNTQTCQQACDTYIQNTGSGFPATATPIAGGKYFYGYNTGRVPNNFCSVVPECQFNHLMWYTTKNRKQASVGAAWYEDGNLISPQASAIVQWDPFVR